MAASARGGRIKILLAVVGGAAVVAMGGWSAAFGDGITVDTSPVAAPIMPGPMTVGDTVTTTIVPVALPGTVLPTEKAVVTHKAQPYKG
ncbi:rare lipoprotein A [Mycolicibacterium rhodesiae JS60]|nr:rare lipoprotein A [Mycolicibacterium rhodesiae JS60]